MWRLRRGRLVVPFFLAGMELDWGGKPQRGGKLATKCVERTDEGGETDAGDARAQSVAVDD